MKLIVFCSILSSFVFSISALPSCGRQATPCDHEKNQYYCKVRRMDPWLSKCVTPQECYENCPNKINFTQPTQPPPDCCCCDTKNCWNYMAQCEKSWTVDKKMNLTCRELPPVVMTTRIGAAVAPPTCFIRIKLNATKKPESFTRGVFYNTSAIWNHTCSYNACCACGEDSCNVDWQTCNALSKSPPNTRTKITCFTQTSYVEPKFSDCIGNEKFRPTCFYELQGKTNASGCTNTNLICQHHAQRCCCTTPKCNVDWESCLGIKNLKTTPAPNTTKTRSPLTTALPSEAASLAASFGSAALIAALFSGSALT